MSVSHISPLHLLQLMVCSAASPHPGGVFDHGTITLLYSPDFAYMKRSTFYIARMDCASEEQLIRMKLQDFNFVHRLLFDLSRRKLDVIYTGDVEPIDDALKSLQLQSTLVATADDVQAIDDESDERQRSVLIKVLIINAALFLLELVTGWLSHSMGLVADSLDMLADAIVYGLSLFAVGAMIGRKKRIAAISGYFQGGLALWGFAEVLRRYLGYGETPDFRLMIGISAIALCGNLASSVLLQETKSEDVHMKASMIFTSNDVLANIAVLCAGITVYLTESKLPDLIIGGIIFVLVARGAMRILQLTK